jgi:hypothetical protein
MVAKKKSTGEKEAKKNRVQLKKLTLNKDTVKDLSSGDRKKVKGGAQAIISLCDKPYK